MRFIFFIGCFIALPWYALAVSSDFAVRASIGSDTTAPTTPIITSAVPVTATQIDLDWAPSTDDFLLSGYTIARGGVHVATTTLTSFSDTGLVPETYYEYSVRAFDWVGNFSSTSLSFGTTTLAVPQSPTSPPTTTVSFSGSGTGSGKLMLRAGLTVTTDLNSALFTWSTSRPSRFELRWGKTASYELGFVTTERFKEEHRTTINDLLPGTTYEYELIGYNTINSIPQLIKRGQFTTKVPATATIPPNVGFLNAEVQGIDVALRWKNPQFKTAHILRVVRNHLQYPIDIYDGMVVYQGTGEEFFDIKSLSAYEKQYYSVFVIDTEGNVSSGAIVSAAKGVAHGPVIGGGNDVGVDAYNGTTSLPLLEIPSVLLPLLDPSMILIIQNSTQQSFADSPIRILHSDPFTLSIPAKSLPQHLKTIIVSLLDPTDYQRSYTFLLRLNAEKTAYETTLAPLALIGISYLRVEIFDYGTNVVGRYGKQIEFIHKVSASGVNNRVIFPDGFIWLFETRYLLWWGIVMILLTLVMWWYRRIRN